MSNTFSHRPGRAGLDGRKASQSQYAGPFFVTAHACERFRERVAPGLSIAHAKREAIALAATARKTGCKTPRGEDIFEATDGAPVKFIVRRDPYMGLVCVTVLGPDACEDDASRAIYAAAV